MSDGVLKEFLVALGFKVDETALKKFNTQLDKIEKQVMSVGKTVAATATGIVVGVGIISRQMENLYYASQRTGETVGNLMALRYAAGQIGLTAEQAQGSLEGFTRTLRLNPGMNSLLTQLGVTGKNPVEKFESFIGRMKQLQPYIAAQYAGLFGIDADTLLMLENGLPKLEAEQRKYQERLKAFGINPEQAAEAGKDFDNSIRSLTADLTLMWTVIESRLVPVLKPMIDQFDRWAQAHADEIARDIASAIQTLATWLQSVDWKQVGDDMKAVYEALGGVKGILIGLAAIKLAPLVLSIIGLATAMTRLGTASKGVAAAGGLGLLGKLGVAGIAAFAGLGIAKAAGLPDTDNKQGIDDVRKGNWLAASAHLPAGEFLRALAARAAGKSNEEIAASLEQGKNPTSKGGKAPASAAQHSFSGAIAQQAPAATGTNDPIAAAQLAQQKYGIPAAVTLAQFGLESGFGKRMPAGSNNPFGIKATAGQPYVEAETTEYVNGVAQRVKQKFAKFDSLADAFEAHAKLLANGRAYARARQYRDNPAAFADALTGTYATDPQYGSKLKSIMSSFGDARLGANGMQLASSGNVTINQKTDVHVSGSSDPDATARAVGSEQSRVNGDLVRNLSGVVA